MSVSIQSYELYKYVSQLLEVEWEVINFPDFMKMTM